MASSNIGTTFYGPNGGSVTVAQGSNGIVLNVVDQYGNSSTYYSNGTSSNTFSGPNGGTATFIQGSAGGAAIKITDQYGNTVIYVVTPPPTNTPQNQSFWQSMTGSGSGSSQYSSYLPQGIPARMIPFGDEDLYILKSEVVPPVCPACPAPVISYSSTSDASTCPPCEPCGRCPEPSFECAKVPNYSAGSSNEYLPIPVLSSFSSFGM